MKETIKILGIETSCDDTAASIISDGKILSSIISNQSVHKAYGGVFPALASRSHQQTIVPVVHQAFNLANVSKTELSAIAFILVPGL